MEIIKEVINIFLWIWSHCPVICLSDDDYFSTLKFNNIRNAHLRFSILNIMLGDSIIYVFSYDIKERKFSFIKILRLTDIDGNILEDEKIDQIQNRFRIHIAELSDDDLEIEKEKLLYHIENEIMSESVSESMSELERTRMQIILNYLDTNKEINSSVAAKLLEVEIKTASRLLLKAKNGYS